MAGEIQLTYQAGATVYALIRNRIGEIWSTSGGTGAFTTYNSSFYTDYDITMTEQGTASAYYLGTMPAAVPPGVYSIVGKRQAGGSPAETDASVAMADQQWNGSVLLPLSDLVTSGQYSQNLPLRIARGTAIDHFGIYFRSAADHVTPFTSGSVSGQIARDNGSFGPLQSGAFTETGNGFYTLRALTSGDLTANTVKLLFTAVNLSGGSADPVPMTLVLQRVSGQL